MTKNRLIKLSNITKDFPGVRALNTINAEFTKGEIHALLGKNGSGKSTLVKILAGMFPPNEGAIYVGEKKIPHYSIEKAREFGIALVHQEMSLVNSLSIGENLFLSTLSQFSSEWKIVDWAKLHSSAAALLEKFKLSLDSKMLVSDISIGEKQMLEILKAIALNPSLLILDEPSSSLSNKETAQLFDFLKNLKNQGNTIIYITHKLQELRNIADTITVLRDGELIGQEQLLAISDDYLLDMMFGQVPHNRIDNNDHRSQEEVVLKVSDFVCKPYAQKISFTLKKGEILGIAGMLGSGRTELLRAIYGLDKREEGEIEVLGKAMIGKITPEKMKAHGIGFISEDRKEEGLFLDLPISFNLNIASLRKNAKKGFIDFKKERTIIDNSVENLQIKLTDTEAPVRMLSGGNQQKIVVANWLNYQPEILFFDEPSRGIDVHAKRQIFEFIFALSKQGKSSIFISTELEEILEICDRILVLNKGRIVKELTHKEVTVNQLYAHTMEENL